MNRILRFAENLWQQEPCRCLAAIALAALAGIAAGHTVIGAVAGSVSVVDGTSMDPTYPPGACVYTVPISNTLERGDVVLLDDGKKEYALKRIVGLPGETINLWRGYVFIDRKMLREPYLPKHMYTFPDQRANLSVFKLGTDQYFVLGDNRTYSVDSRSYGAVERPRIKSRVPPPDNAPHATSDAYTLPEPGKRTIRPL